MSKAWCCIEEESGVVEVVFANTRGKAKSYFKDIETFDYYNFCELRPYRIKNLDHLNKSDGYIMDWRKDEDRLPMVRDADFSCVEVDREECEGCCAKEWCSKYEEDNERNHKRKSGYDESSFT